MGWLIFVVFIVIAISVYATVRKNSANEITRLNAQNKPLRDHIHNEIETINRVIDIVSNYRSQNVQEEKLIKLFKSLNNSEKIENLSLSFSNFESTDFSSVRNSIVAKLPIEYSKDFPTDNIGLESYTKNLVDKKEELSKIYNDLSHNSFTQDELLELYKKYCPQKLKLVKKDNCKHGWKIVGVISIYTIIVAGLIALGVYYSSIPASVMAKAAYKESIENQFKDTRLPDIKITDITFVLDEHSSEYTYEWYKVTKITATSTKISNYYAEKDNKEKAYELQMILWDVYLKATYHNSDYEHMNGWTIDIESGDTIEFIIYDDVGNSYSYSRANGKNPKLKINEKEFR